MRWNACCDIGVCLGGFFVICQYCGGENVSTENNLELQRTQGIVSLLQLAFDTKDAELTKCLDILKNVACVYWQNYRGIGKSSEAIEFTDALGKALGEYKGDGA
jgi:hypothetical protein